MKKQKWHFLLKICLISVIGIFVLIGIFKGASPYIEKDLEERRVETIREAVESSALECYAVEGVYPQDLDYLEQHYGLMINHDRYIVSYECFAANQPPEVMVLKR